jgi:hypothetical protein
VNEETMPIDDLWVGIDAEWNNQLKEFEK